MEILINILFLFVGYYLIKYSQNRYISYVNHLSIYGFVWPFITIGTQIVYPKALSIEVVFLFYVCWIFYIIGSSLIKHKILHEPNHDNLYYFKMKILIVLLLLFCFISNWELFSLILNTSNLLAWATLRKENGFEDLDSNVFFTIFQRVYLVYIPLGLLLFYKKKLSLIFFVGLVVSGIVFSSLRFTRAPILNLFIVLLVSYVYIYRKKLPLFSILIGSSLILIIFSVSMLILTNGVKNYNVFDDISLYLFGGQVAYQDFYEGVYIDNAKYSISNYSLDFFNYILKKIGIIDTYPSYVRNYTYRGNIFTNTYTYLDCFTYDLGVFGALLGSFLIGFFSDFAYHLYIKRKNIFALIFYGFICYYNCFIFANNEFIRFPVLLSVITLFFYNFIVTKKKYVI